MKRVLTALVLIPLVLILVFLGPKWLISLAVAGVAALAAWECLELAERAGAKPPRIAVLVAILAKKMNWDQSSIDTLCRAGATMNIAMLELQSVLTAQKEPITIAQREEIRSHGIRGREILERLGVTDQDCAWERTA